MPVLFEELRKRNWVIWERGDTSELLTEEGRSRYPSVPSAVTEFLTKLEVCHNAEENAWLLTPEEFQKTDTDGFRWNEYELMALEDAENDPERQAEVRAFWNQHFPIMLAVHSDYDYLAVRVTEPNFGSIVHGFAPEWENPSIIARSFEEFLLRFAEEAASSEPEYPYDVFL